MNYYISFFANFVKYQVQVETRISRVTESCDDFKSQHHHFHWVPQFVPKMEDLDEAGLAFELERRKREPLIGRPVEQRDDEEEAEVEEETEEKKERTHSLCVWDVETKRKKSRRRRCL